MARRLTELESRQWSNFVKWGFPYHISVKDVKEALRADEICEDEEAMHGIMAEAGFELSGNRKGYHYLGGDNPYSAVTAVFLGYWHSIYEAAIAQGVTIRIFPKNKQKGETDLT